MIPSTSRIDQAHTHRLIPSEYSGPVLADLFDTDEEADAVFELDGATNERLLAQADSMPGIDRSELVFQVPHYTIINAAFVHARENGGRFNTSMRGAWYASFELDTSLAEVIWHHTQWLKEINLLEDNVTKDQWNASFHGDFHDVRNDERFGDCLTPDPTKSYIKGQRLAEQILNLPEGKGIGIVYPSARAPEGTNIVCFRPALVDDVKKGTTYRFIWDGNENPQIKAETFT